MPVCRIFDSKGRELTQCSTDVFSPHSKIYFGRSSKCEVCLKALADSTISRQHFYLQESLTGQWSINDNDSRAGLFHDAKKVKSVPLFDGTIIRFGGLFFAFGEKGVPSHYRLKWTGMNGHETHGCLWEGVNSVGSSRDNYVTVREGDISRFHILVTVHGKQIYMEAVNSMLETDVGGEPIDGAVELKAGDVISMAGFPVELDYIDTVAKRAAVIMSEKEVAQRNENVRSVKKTATVLAYSLLGAGLLFLIALGLMAIKWLPGGAE